MFASVLHRKEGGFEQRRLLPTRSSKELSLAMRVLSEKILVIIDFDFRRFFRDNGRDDILD
jgi:hypothetical protein